MRHRVTEQPKVTQSSFRFEVRVKNTVHHPDRQRRRLTQYRFRQRAFIVPDVFECMYHRTWRTEVGEMKALKESEKRWNCLARIWQLHDSIH